MILHIFVALINESTQLKKIMIISSFIIKGISNIDQLVLNIGKKNALIAPNGYGKSNVLSAISFGTNFISANENDRRQMLSSRFQPINVSMKNQNFYFEINGEVNENGETRVFQYGFECEWANNGRNGTIVAEWCRIKNNNERRFRQLLNRTGSNKCLIVPSSTGRCNKPFEVTSLQLALPIIAGGAMFLSDIAKQICGVNIPNLETLDNPESYFSVDGGRGIPLLDGMTLSEYIFRLKQSDEYTYGILSDGLKQLIPRIIEFEPDEITLSDGLSKVYDIRVMESFNSHPTSIRLLSSGSKRMIFLFTLCVAAQKQNIPMIMVEEPENSVHPRLMENLLLTLDAYASNTKILMTSHSPYLMRYMLPDQLYFGLPKKDGLAHFAKVNPSKLKYLYRYAGEMELTFGEFMFDFMLDIEDNDEKLNTFFK